MKDFMEIIHNRKTIRRYQERPIEEDILRQVLDCAVQSPTAMNRQARKYTVLQDKMQMQRLEQAVQSALERNSYSFNNPAAFIFVSVPRDLENGMADTSCAMQNMMLASTYLDLGSCWINQLKHCYDDPGVREILTDCHIPEDHVVYACLALGYPDQDPAPKEKSEWIEFL